MDETEAAVRGYFLLEGAKDTPSIAKFGRLMYRTLWAGTAIAGAILAYRVWVDGTIPLVPAALLVALFFASVVAVSARNDSKAFGDGLFVFVRPDTAEAMKAFAVLHPEKASILPLDRRGDGEWAPIALVRLQELGAGGFPPIDYDFYEPKGRRGRALAPRIGPDGQPVCLLVIHGQRHSYDQDLSAAADIILSRTVLAVRT